MVTEQLRYVFDPCQFKAMKPPGSLIFRDLFLESQYWGCGYRVIMLANCLLSMVYFVFSGDFFLFGKVIALFFFVAYLIRSEDEMVLC